MSNSLSPSHAVARSRLQVSLRMLILLMTLAGFGLMLYRLPWEERSDGSYGDYRIVNTTTYHRNWRGQKEPHGRSTMTTEGRLELESMYHHGQQVYSHEFNWQGQLVESYRYYDSGRFDYAAGDGTTWVRQLSWSAEGLDGPAQEIVSRRKSEEGRHSIQFTTGRFNGGLNFPQDPIRVKENWHKSQRHGTWTWQTMDGETLNIAEYRDNELIEWNGEPVVQRFEKWALGKAADHSLLRDLLGSDARNWYQARSSWSLLITRADEAQPSQLPLHIFFDGPLPKDLQLRKDQSFASALCEFALLQGLCLSYRYGLLWLTPQSEASSTFADRTGVDRVAFAPKSKQEKEWEASVTYYDGPSSLQHRLREFTRGSGIDLDLSQLEIDREEPGSQEPGRQQKGEPFLELPRRDMLGYLFYSLGFRCEQNGNTLIVSRRWEPLTSPETENTLDPFAAPSHTVDPFR